MYLLKEITNIEMDLRFEAAAANEYAENTKNDLGFKVPQIYWNFTGQNVLTLDWVEGVSIRETETLKNKNIEAFTFWDTALAAKHLSTSNEEGAAAICSVEAAKLYWLNILDTNIADQKGNTTRFAIIVHKNSKLKYSKNKNQSDFLFLNKRIQLCLFKEAKNTITKNEIIHKQKD